MSELNVRRWTGAFGIASGALILVLFVIYSAIGMNPRAEDATRFTDYVTKHNGLLLTLTLAYTLSAACFVVFLAGVRHLMRQAKPNYEWASAIVFGSGPGLDHTRPGWLHSHRWRGPGHGQQQGRPHHRERLGEGSTPAFVAI